jgi:nucleotide-binding universal stress UspA family protein
MKIMVAIDQSEQSKTVLLDVGQRLWGSDAEFMLLNVIEHPAVDILACLGAITVDEIKLRLKEKSEDLLDNAAVYLREQLDEKQLVRKSTGEGRVADTVIGVAGEWGADLIIVGSHSRTGLPRLFLGSVAESIVLHAPCSVEVVRSRQDLNGIKSEKLQGAVALS